MERIILAGLVPVGFQTLALDNTTAVGVNSTCRAANVLDIGVETTDARLRADGTDPTNSVGVVIPKGLSPFRFFGYNGSADLKFCRSGESGTSTVSIQAYKAGP